MTGKKHPHLKWGCFYKFSEFDCLGVLQLSVEYYSAGFSAAVFSAFSKTCKNTSLGCAPAKATR